MLERTTLKLTLIEIHLFINYVMESALYIAFNLSVCLLFSVHFWCHTKALDVFYHVKNSETVSIVSNLTVPTYTIYFLNCKFVGLIISFTLQYLRTEKMLYL